MSKSFGYLDKNNTTHILTQMDGEFSNMGMDIMVHEMLVGDKLSIEYKNKECIFLLVKGEIEFQYEGRTSICKRASFLEEEPTCLHVSREKKVTLVALEKSEVLLQTTINLTFFETKLYEPNDCRILICGDGLYDGRARRLVRTIIDYENAPYSNLVIGEVVSESGGWSSYIPHHHPQPEVYYYRYEREEGFGACFIGDEVYKVRDKSFSAIEGGHTHPQVSAPGYPMYYAWMIKHFEGNPWTSRIDDERYLWLLNK